MHGHVVVMMAVDAWPCGVVFVVFNASDPAIGQLMQVVM